MYLTPLCRPQIRSYHTTSIQNDNKFKSIFDRFRKGKPEETPKPDTVEPEEQKPDLEDFAEKIPEPPKKRVFQTEDVYIRKHAHGSRKDIPISVQKLKEVCRSLRGLRVDDALDQLRVNERRVSFFVMKTLKNAKNNASHLGLDCSNLFVAGFGFLYL